MEKAVIGVFDNSHEVQELIRDLETEGFERSKIDVMDQQEFADSTSRKSESGSSQGRFSGVRNWFYNLGVAEDETDLFAESVRRGSTVVALTTDESNVDRASELMHRHGAIDIDERSEFYRKSGFKQFDEAAPPYTRDESIAERERFAPGGQFSVPIVEEEVSIGKQRVPTGRVRIVTRVVERPIDQDITLRDEHIEVERRAADRPANASDMEAFKEGTLEFNETTEVPVVSKEARVTEEVLVSKEAEEHTETVHEKARRREVDVERGSENINKRP